MIRCGDRVNGVALCLLIFLFLFPVALLGQGGVDPLKCEEPYPPEIEMVTVDPNTGTTTLTWGPPIPKGKACPAPQGYIIYSVTESGENVVLWEVGPDEYVYHDMTADARNRSYSYRMASKGFKGNSVITDKHSTLFVSLEYDTCADKAMLNWIEGPYKGWGNSIAAYVIYKGETPNSDMLAPVDRLEKASHSSYVDDPILKNKVYYYYVAAEHKTKTDGEGKPLITRSNMMKLTSRKLEISAKSKIDTILCNEDYNQIIYTIDSISAVSYYKIMRQENPEKLAGRLGARVIDSFTVAKQRMSIDDTDDLDIQGRQHYYSVNTVDRCGEDVYQSPFLNSVTTRVGQDGKLHTITWDPLYIEDKFRAEYRLYRHVRQGKDRRHDSALIATLGHGEEYYVDDVSEFQGRNYDDLFCYKVHAREIDTAGQTTRVVVAHPRCIRVEAKVDMPNAIDPMTKAATDGVPRDRFAPVSDFEVDYLLYIFNRAGEKIYTGESVGWDGRLRDGSFAPEGAYIYRIEIREEGKPARVQTGSFMVVYPTRRY